MTKLEEQYNKSTSPTPSHEIVDEDEDDDEHDWWN